MEVDISLIFQSIGGTMKKTNSSLACPLCHSDGIKMLIIDNLKEKAVNTLEIVRRYNCYCERCQKWYQADYGKAILQKYNPAVSETVADDVKLYVSYESEFDRSYKIVSIDNTMMIMAEDDEYPIIIEVDYQREFINSHSKTKRLVNNTWMRRYR